MAALTSAIEFCDRQALIFHWGDKSLQNLPLYATRKAPPEIPTKPVSQTGAGLVTTLFAWKASRGFFGAQTGLKRTEASTGAVTLIQRFGSAANLNIHLHCLVLDGVYRTTGGVPVFLAVRAPTAEQLQTLLTRIIKRMMKLLTLR